MTNTRVILFRNNFELSEKNFRKSLKCSFVLNLLTIFSDRPKKLKLSFLVVFSLVNLYKFRADHVFSSRDHSHAY